jgi:nitroimidazol reductase NimA-like FMN-containing flavoprotein (pyridoxamine 5'-phosphate oxidase superfamily)
MARQLDKTGRTTHRRLPERGSHDVEEAYAILDEALYCHVGFVVDGKPVVIPTIHARDGDRLVLHGSVASRMLRVLQGGADACVTVTLLDGLVMARSVFHHSMNYRSVVVFGTARLIEDETEKLAAMAAITEHVARGRWNDARQPNRREAKETMIIEIPLSEASVKTRTGPPGDDDEDLELDVWAGVIPVATAFGEPAAAPDLDPAVGLPPYLTDYRR